jgi:hypothetical protein
MKGLKNGCSILILFFSVNVMGQTDFITIKDSLYRLSVPSYMEKYEKLIDGPGLQMISNSGGKLLLTLITDKKSEINALDSGFSSQQYYDYVAQKVAEKLTSSKIYHSVSDSINHLPYIAGQVRGKLQGTQMIYYIRTIETPDYYFQIVIWMEEREESDPIVRSDIRHILDSFEFLKRNGN